VSGTTPSRLTDRDDVRVTRRSFGLAVACGAALVLLSSLSASLPYLAPPAGVVLWNALALALLGLLEWGLLPLLRVPRALPALAVAALAASVALVALEWQPGAVVSKTVLGAAVGFWIAAALERAWWGALVALVAPVFDVLSVLRGPTRVLLEEAPEQLPWFTVALAVGGYSLAEGASQLGVADLLFYGLFLGAARRFGLRAGLTAVAMSVSFVATIAAALWWTALPALPLLAGAFLLVNADRLLADWRTRRSAA
jgi:hypothetical protein